MMTSRSKRGVRTWGALAVSTAVMACLAAPAMAAKVKITVWHALPSGAATNTFNEFVEEFKAAYPDIELEVVRQTGYEAALEKAQVALAGGVAPNIAMFEQTRNTVFVDSNALLPLNSFLEGPNGIDIKDFHPAMLNTVTYNGKIYGIPYNTSTPLIYYNRDLFEESGLKPVAPKTWSELLAAATKITRDTDGDGKPNVYGIDFYEWGWLFEAWIGQNGARVLSPDGTRFTFNSPAAVEAMQFTQDLVHKHKVAFAGPGSEGYKLFWNNQLGMAERSTASLANNIRQAKFDMGVAPLACNKECYAPIGGANFVMFNTGTAAEKQAAWEFLRFISSSDRLARFAAATGYMAARLSSVRGKILQEHFAKEPRARVTYEQLDHAYPRPKVPFWQEIDDQLARLWTVMFKENGNAKQVLDEVAQNANNMLRDYLAKKR